MSYRITPNRVYALNRLLEALTGKDRSVRLYVVSELVGREVISTSDLTNGDWCAIRDAAYPNWRGEDWTIGQEFSRQVAALTEQYREQVLGQMRLF